MIIKTITGGIFASNSYLICEKDKAVLIDLGVKTEAIMAAAHEMNVTIEKIIMTHGHIDHIVELDNILKETNAKAYIHVDDEPCLTNAKLNVSAFTFSPKTVNSRCEILRDGSSISLGDLELKVIHTPGHSPGSICILAGSKLFSGDTLFNNGYGNYELPNGNFEDLYKSIVEKLFTLPEDTDVYPGHGISTTIGNEKKSNPIRHAVEW